MLTFLLSATMIIIGLNILRFAFSTTALPSRNLVPLTMMSEYCVGVRHLIFYVRVIVGLMSRLGRARVVRVRVTLELKRPLWSTRLLERR